MQIDEAEYSSLKLKICNFILDAYSKDPTRIRIGRSIIINNFNTSLKNAKDILNELENANIIKIIHQAPNDSNFECFWRIEVSLFGLEHIKEYTKQTN